MQGISLTVARASCAQRLVEVEADVTGQPSALSGELEEDWVSSGYATTVPIEVHIDIEWVSESHGLLSILWWQKDAWLGG